MIESLSEFNSVSYMCKVNDNFLETIVLVDGTSPNSKSQTEWFYTRNGKKMDYSIPWRTGQPDDLGIERCLDFSLFEIKIKFQVTWLVLILVLMVRY